MSDLGLEICREDLLFFSGGDGFWSVGAWTGKGGEFKVGATDVDSLYRGNENQLNPSSNDCYLEGQGT